LLLAFCALAGADIEFCQQAPGRQQIGLSGQTEAAVGSFIAFLFVVAVYELCLSLFSLFLSFSPSPRVVTVQKVVCLPRRINLTLAFSGV
jgi:hypothetical protein